MQYLKQNTAVTVAIGLAVDWRDGKTLLVETPTLSDLACTLYKNGSGAAKTLTGNLSVDATGMVLLDLTAADTDTTGRLDIVLRNAVVDGYPTDILLPRVAGFGVICAESWDALYNDGFPSVDYAGAGDIAFTYTLTSSVDGSPIPQAQVWATTDAGGHNVAAAGYTDDFGRVTFNLAAGTYYFWRRKSGWQFNNPDIEEVTNA